MVTYYEGIVKLHLVRNLSILTIDYSYTESAYVKTPASKLNLSDSRTGFSSESFMRQKKVLD